VNAVAANKKNARQLKESMDKWVKVKRTASHDDVMNHFGGQACLWAVKFTPKAKKGWLTERHRPKLNTEVTTRRRRATGHASFFHALVSKPHGSHSAHPKGQGNYNQALKVFKSKRRAIGACAAGFLKPARDLGRNVRGGRVKLNNGGSASRSHGKKSKRGEMEARSFNNVKGSGDVAFGPMNRAINEVSRRELEWANKRIQQANDSFMVNSVKSAGKFFK
jgi:hypothetical protein